MQKLNCWEFKKCGMQPGGFKSEEQGVCPVPTFKDFDGAYGGKNGGRTCWAVSTSYCGGRRQGVFAQKLEHCMKCDFFNSVKADEERSGHGFAVTPTGIRIYLRKRFRHRAAGPFVTVDDKQTVEAEKINDIAQKYLIVTGSEGKKLIDAIFIELNYRRGSQMTSSDFTRFIRYLLDSLTTQIKYSEFLQCIPSLGQECDLDIRSDQWTVQVQR